MRFKRGDTVRWKDDLDINEKLRGKLGKILGRYKGSDVPAGETAYKVKMLDPDLIPRECGAETWHEDYWCPSEDRLILVTKLEKMLE